MTRKTPLVTATMLFLLSGFAALLYQVIWQRILGIFSGVHIYSVTIIVSAFMAGLGFGSLLGGRFADRLSRAGSITAFAVCEFVIGVFALISPWLYYDVAYLHLGFLVRYDLLLPAIHLLLLVVPTFLMGASLPLLSRGLVLRTESAARVIGVLYSVNTLGAALGALVTVWFLIGTLGFVGAIRTGAVINFIVAAGAFWVRKNLPEKMEVPGNGSAPQAIPGLGRGEATPAVARRMGIGAWAGIYGLSGFIALSLEILWFRILAVIIKSSPYLFGHVLGLFLFFLAIGGLAGTYLVQRARRPDLIFLWGQWATSVLAVLAILWLSYLPDHSWPMYKLVEFWWADGPIPMRDIAAGWQQFTSWPPPAVLRLAALLWGVLPFVLMAPATFFMGFTYAYIQRTVQTDLREVGRRVGLIQTTNIAGSMLGSLLTGGLFLTLLGTPRTLSLLVLVGAIFGCLAVYRSRRRAWPAAAAVVVAAMLLAAAIPQRDSFWARLHGSPLEDLKIAEDASSIVAMQMVNKRFAVIRVNGYGNSLLPFGDVWTQLGLIPTLLHPDAADVLVIGMGTGGTAWAMSSVPEVRRIDLYEIAKPELEVLQRAQQDWFQPGPVDQLLTDPRLHLTFGDGRLALRTEARQYDVIEADARSPEEAYSGNLYSQEFFEETRLGLKPGGLMCSHVPTERTGRTFLSVFPHVLDVHRGGVRFMIGSNEPLRFDRASLLSRLNSAPVQRRLQATPHGRIVALGVAQFLREARVESFDNEDRQRFAEEDINTDLFPRDEYGQLESSESPSK